MPPALADQLEQATPRMVVVLVLFQVLDELVDAAREQRDLDLGRAGIPFVGVVLGDDLFLVLLRQGQRAILLSAKDGGMRPRGYGRPSSVPARTRCISLPLFR